MHDGLHGGRVVGVRGCQNLGDVGWGSSVNKSGISIGREEQRGRGKNECSHHVYGRIQSGRYSDNLRRGGRSNTNVHPKTLGHNKHRRGMATTRTATTRTATTKIASSKTRSKPTIRSTDIVTSFVRDKESGKILIVRRSNKVRSMRDMWSGISGVIEGREEPLTRAKIEIFEETGITEDKLRLVKRTNKMRIDSPQYKNHEWLVFSFLFETHDTNICLNWENSDYRWIDIDELGSYETVPDLERVLFYLL